MARDVNSVTLLGNLGADPELRHTTNGQPVCNLRVATNKRVKTDDGYETKVEWHTVVTFGQPAEFAAKYLKKGSRVLVLNGELQTRKWKDKDDNDRYSTEIVSFDISSQDKREAEAEEDQPPRRQAARTGGKPFLAKSAPSRGKPRTEAFDETEGDEIPW